LFTVKGTVNQLTGFKSKSVKVSEVSELNGSSTVEIEKLKLKKEKREWCDRENELLELCVILLSQLVPISQTGAGRP